MLDFTKAVSTGILNYGDKLHYYLTLYNNGPDTATGVSVFDQLPTGIIYQSSVANIGSYNQNTHIWNIGSLNLGQTAFLDITALINTTGLVNNIATLTQTTYPQTAINRNIEFTVPLAADIGVSKNLFYEDLGPIIFPDNPLDRYWKFFSEVVVTNNGPDTATNVKITDLLGSGLSLAPFDPFGSWFVTYTGQNPDLDPPENNPSFDPLTMIWTIPTMNNGDIWVLDFFTVANTNGTVNNTATFDPATADQYDWNSDNNVGFVETYIPTAQTQLTKWFQKGSTYGSPHTTKAYYNDNLYAFIKLYNIGPDTAKFITVIDDFSNDVTYNSALMETSYDGGLTWIIDPNAYWLDFGTYFELEWFPTDIAQNSMALFRIPGQIKVSNSTITNIATETQRTFNPDGNNTDNPPINQPGFNTIIGTTTLNVPPTPTSIVVNSAIGHKGAIVNLIATLKDTHLNVPLIGKTINFSINGISVGNAVTNSNGIATLAYKIIQNSGKYTILAKFTQTTPYAASSNTNTLKVDNTPPTASATPHGGLYNTSKTVTLKMSESGIIYYTLNGSNPTTSSSKYTSPIKINSTKTLKFFAVDLANNKSPIYTEKYTIDKSAPTVSSTNPVNNANGVSLTSSIIIKFNENILTGVNYSKISIKNLSTGKTVSITKNISGNTLTIKMTSSRLHNNTYQVTIPSKSVKDKAGNNLATTNTIKFKTN